MSKRTTQLCTLFFLFLAVLLRCIVYFQNRSLFLDEINLSRNVVEKPYWELFGQLDYEQFAPPLYLSVVKFCTQLFGVNEFSLRLFPLLLGLGSLFLIYKIVQKLFDNPVMIYPILLFGFSIYLLRYQTENKQYSADVFFTLLFIFTSLYYKINSFRNYFFLGIAGAIGIWFSMPIVFPLVGVGCYILYEQLNKPIDRKEKQTHVFYVCMMIALWLLSFGVFYFFFLKQSIESKYLQDFHENAYLQLPNSIAKINNSSAILKSLLISMVGEHLLSRVWAIICIFLGVYSIIRKDFGKSLLLILPIASCFIASVLDQFILIPRVSLFLMPLFFILIGLGASVLYEKVMTMEGVKKYIGLILILIPICFTIVGKTGIPYFVKTYELEHSRPVIQKLQEHPEKELPIYVYHNAVPAYKFYTQLYEPNIEVATSFVQYGDWSDEIPQLVRTWKEKGIQKLWILDSHTFGDELQKIKKEIKQIGKTETILEGENTTFYLVELI